MSVALAFFSMGPQEMLIFGIIAVLLFGKRLPEVGRNLGKSFVEFKKGMSGLEDEFRSVASTTSTYTPPSHTAAVEHEEATAPKFEPPPSEPSSPPAPEATSTPAGEQIEA
jgi:sec-independent protein translocase protein TatA